MKFKLSGQDLGKLKELIETNSINQSISSMLLDAYVYFRPKHISGLDEYIDKLKSFFEIEELEDIKLFNHFIGENIRLEDSNCLINNEYYKNIRPATVKSGKYQIVYDSYKPFELFSSDDFEINQKYEEMNKLRFFDKETKFLTITEDNETWMSITPNEIHTMDKAVKEAHGKVLALGLGLGYFPYMVSNKVEVESVTVIELNREIIDLFNKSIKPMINNKVKIINDDGYKHLKEYQNKYDYIFVDTYHNPVDGLQDYKRFLDCNVKKEHFIWLENSIIQYARRILISLMEESLNQVDEKIYLNPRTDEDRLYTALYNLTKEKVFTSYSEINNFISKENIVSLLKENRS